MLTQRDLEKLTDFPVELIDRSTMPHENKFAALPKNYDGISTIFTTKEIQERREAIQAQTPSISNYNDKSSHFLNSMFCEALTTSTPGLSSHTLEEGIKILGKSFLKYFANPMRTVHALILPIAPHLSEKEFWTQFLRFPIETTKSKDIQKIGILHEIGHSIFPISQKTKSGETEFFAELLPDIWSLQQYQAMDFPQDAVQDHIDARAFIGFTLTTPSSYLTSETCEAALSSKKMPVYAEIVSAYRELQCRTHLSLNRQNTVDMDLSTCQAKYPLIATNANDSAWTTESNILTSTLQRIPISQAMQALNFHLTQNKRLSPTTLQVGEGIIKSYENFYPQSAKGLSRPKKIFLLPPGPLNRYDM